MNAFGMKVVNMIGLGLLLLPGGPETISPPSAKFSHKLLGMANIFPTAKHTLRKTKMATY